MIESFPNPVRSQTTIKYRVAESSNVAITIYDINGRKVSTLVNQKQDAGVYELNWNADNASNGIYFASFSC